MNPLAILFLFFLTIPLVEIYLLIKVGGVIGAPMTIFLVVFTAVLGAWLLRIQGFSTLRRIQQTVNQGGLPAVELLEGALLLLAGALLLTPGFFTDAIGFACLVPPLRRALIMYAMRRFFAPPQYPGFDPRDSGHAEHIKQRQQKRPKQQPNRTKHPTHTIEGEYTREDD
ncbi:MAG: FxsA family protein [Gammaproteobacteria bacterium]|jgi:UPF0716 protein FxsA